jgi:DMSO/TMAO reductase YedYZ molybdopterin-dependent catalytic subunit
VENPIEYTYEQLTSMPQTRYTRSFHCVTQWSIKDVEWEGLPIRGPVEPAKVNPEAKWVMLHTVRAILRRCRSRTVSRRMP